MYLQKLNTLNYKPVNLELNLAADREPEMKESKT